MFSKDTPSSHYFFSEWHRLWMLGYNLKISSDQMSLNQANINSNQCLTELDGKWNVQFLHGGLRYIAEAKILHYFYTITTENPFLLARKEVFDIIRKHGITEEIKASLVNPRKQFSLSSQIFSDKKIIALIDTFTYFIRRSNIVSLLYKLVIFIRLLKCRFFGYR